MFVGKVIKEQRISNEISLDRASRDLNISKEILNKIEHDEIDEQISFVFFIGHVRSYSSYLGLDSSYIVKKFKNLNSPDPLIEEIKIPKPYINQNTVYLFKFFSIFLIFIISTSFYFLFIDVENIDRDYVLLPDLPESYNPIVEKIDIELSKNQLQNKQNDEFPIELENISSSSAIASSKVSNEIISNNVTLKILNPTWIQLRDINNNIIISKLMKKNEEYNYEMNNNYSITAGNAGNILVLINNNVKGRIGKIGQVLDSFIVDNNFDN